jgi:hypothetical protein
VLNTNKVIAKVPIAIELAISGKLRALLRIGLYQFWILSINLSEKLFLKLIVLLKNNEDATGTHVSESSSAPIMAKETVWAMGLNIFPSIPMSERIGT